MRRCLSAALVLLATTVARAADWPCWRGAAYDGVTSESLPAEIGDGSLATMAWETGVGEGCGSVAVVGGRVYTMGWAGGQESVVCLAAETGQVVWRRSYAAPRYGRHALGDQEFYSGPTSTPTFDPASGLLFTLGTDGQLVCWDTAKEGAEVWSLNLYDRYGAGRRPDVGGGQRDFGYTTAPLVRGGLVLVGVGERAGLIVAHDKRTGERRWAAENSEPVANAGGMTPLTVGGVPCVAVLSLKSLVVVRTDEGHEGKTLAQYAWQTEYANNQVTPAVAGNRVLLSSSLNLSKSVLLELSEEGARKVWESPRYTGVSSPVVFRGKIYTVHNKVRCQDLATGALLWEGGRTGQDSSCVATADGRLVVFGSGRLSIVETAERSPKAYVELAHRDKVCAPNDAWPHVVLADGRIYCKDRKGVVRCVRLGR